MQKQIILTSRWCGEHLFTGPNTQQVLVVFILNFILCLRAKAVLTSFQILRFDGKAVLLVLTEDLSLKVKEQSSV